MIELSVSQTILLCDNVKLKYNFSTITFSSCAVQNNKFIYNTCNFNRLPKVSMGTTYCLELLDETIYFTENIISSYKSVDENNLA